MIELLLLTVSLAAVAADVPFRMIVEGPHSGVEEPRTMVARSEKEYLDLVKLLPPRLERPTIDFQSEMVAAVFVGSRPTAGFRVSVTRVRTEGNELMIEYAERKPPPDSIVAQVLTSPFTVVAMARHDEPVRFERAK